MASIRVPATGRNGTDVRECERAGEQRSAGRNHGPGDAGPAANHVYLFDYSTSILLTSGPAREGAVPTVDGSGKVAELDEAGESGNVFSMYGSADGVNWVALGRARR